MRYLGRNVLAALTATCTMMPGSLTLAQPAAASKLSILLIMADDIGDWNISTYNRGMMGYHTPNIDRIANEGATDWSHKGPGNHPSGPHSFRRGPAPARIAGKDNMQSRTKRL
jgi:hypothetical protein